MPKFFGLMWLEKCWKSCRLLSLYIIMKVRVGPKDIIMLYLPRSFTITLPWITFSFCLHEKSSLFSSSPNDFPYYFSMKRKAIEEIPEWNRTTTRPPLYFLLQNMFCLWFYIRRTISFVHPVPCLFASKDISPAILNFLSCITNIPLITGYSQWHKLIWFFPSCCASCKHCICQGRRFKRWRFNPWVGKIP